MSCSSICQTRRSVLLSSRRAALFFFEPKKHGQTAAALSRSAPAWGWPTPALTYVHAVLTERGKKTDTTKLHKKTRSCGTSASRSVAEPRLRSLATTGELDRDNAQQCSAQKRQTSRKARLSAFPQSSSVPLTRSHAKTHLLAQAVFAVRLDTRVFCKRAAVPQGRFQSIAGRR